MICSTDTMNGEILSYIIIVLKAFQNNTLKRYNKSLQIHFILQPNVIFKQANPHRGNVVNLTLSPTGS